MAYLTILSIQICYENVKMLLVFVMLFDGPILGWPSPDLLCSLGNRQAADKQKKSICSSCRMSPLCLIRGYFHNNCVTNCHLVISIQF